MDGGGKQARTVLVVDDDPSLRLLCRVNLELDGYRVLEAASVPEATTALDADDVDVVLLDLHLGTRSGLEVLDAVEARELPTRVVLLSGSSEIGDADRARAAAVLGKPFTLDALARAVGDDTAGRVRDA